MHPLIGAVRNRKLHGGKSADSIATIRTVKVVGEYLLIKFAHSAINSRETAIALTHGNSPDGAEGFGYYIGSWYNNSNDIYHNR